jgi:hypothetical protein
MNQRSHLLPLSLTYSGTIDFNQDIDAAVLPSHLAANLRGVYASSVKMEVNRVAFTGGAFRFVSSWNVLVPFGFGEITVDSDALQIRYRLSFRQLFIFAIAGLAYVAWFLYSSGAPRQMLAIFIPVGLIWLVGGNLAIGIPRFNGFVRRAIETAPRRNMMTTPL